MGAMFSKPKIPKVAEPEPIPMVDEAELEKKRRRALTTLSARGGRQSTLLTERDTLGG